MGHEELIDCDKCGYTHRGGYNCAAVSASGSNDLLGNSVFLSNLHYFFAKTDGTYDYPKGAVGDLLKQAKKEIEAFNNA